MTARYVPLCLMLAALGLTPLAHAQDLQDPTRPPAAMSAPASSEGVSVSGPSLQSVLISPSGRRVAVIDGQTLRVGERYKGATLASMSATEVVLVQGKQRQILKLYPTAASQ